MPTPQLLLYVFLPGRRSCTRSTMFGPFNCNTQTRWKKPIDSAQTRMENRTLDPNLDKLMAKHRKLKVVLKLHEIMSRRRRYARHVLVEMLTRWRNIAGLNARVGDFLRRSSHVFKVYAHPVSRALCCRVSGRMRGLIVEEARAVREHRPVAVEKLKKIIMLSTSGTVHVHAVWLVMRELGLPDDFRDSVIAKHPKVFRVVGTEIVGLVSRDEGLAVAEVEKWREKEYREKWLSEFETKYAFLVQFPTGFRIERGFRERLKNWQRMQYLKPYEKADVVRARTCGGAERYEKRAVAIIHELLSLTVEKMVAVERLAHFRKDLSMEVNVRELLLKHPGIFYISTRDGIQTVFLREAYSKGCLIQPNLIYKVRRKMLELVSLGRRNTRTPIPSKVAESTNELVAPGNKVEDPINGDWLIPILLKCEKQ